MPILHTKRISKHIQLTSFLFVFLNNLKLFFGKDEKEKLI